MCPGVDGFDHAAAFVHHGCTYHVVHDRAGDLTKSPCLAKKAKLHADSVGGRGALV